MDPVLEELGRVAGGLAYRVPGIAWASGLTGELVSGCTAGYWAAQAREPVRYADAVAALAQQGVGVFIEVGPDGTLSALGPAALDHGHGRVHDQDHDHDRDRAGDSAAEAAFIPVQRPGQDAAPALVAALAAAHVRGVPVDWARVLPAGQRTELPTYAFQRQRYWPVPPALAAGGDGAGSVAEAGFWAAVEGGDVHALAETLAMDSQQQLARVVPALAAWRRREREQSLTAGWRYRVTWVPVSAAGSGVLAGRWLVVAPDGPAGAGLARACGEALTAAGAEVTGIRVPAAAGRDDVAARLAAAVAGSRDGQEGGPVVAGVVSLLALAAGPLPGRPAVPEGLAGTLALVQALGDAGITAPLWVLTQGAVAAGAGDMLSSPVQAQAWGLGRVAALEHPDRWGGLVDLPAAWDARTGSRLCAVLAGCGEDQAAVRPAGIMARRLTRAPEPRRTRPWAPRGTVLITGGTGAIGGHAARFAASRGASRVLLASRSGPAAAGAAALAAGLAAAGTTVTVAACDTADRTQLTALLRRITTSGPPLTTIMHTAGTRQTIAIEEATVAELSSVAAAKAGGAALLDELTSNLDLDAFVLFSSISSTWGSGLQPGYAAANVFLDGLAEHRLGRGLPATSVGWGLWGGGGMTSGEDGIQLQRRGLRVMDPALAIQALGHALDSGEGNVTIADVDWGRFAPAFTLRRPSPLLQDLPDVARALAAAAHDSAPADPSHGELARQLAGLPRAEQDRVLTDLVRAEAAAVLGHSSPQAVESGQAFKDLGFDSLTAVELRNRLSTVTGLYLPATLVFDYPNPVTLAGHLRAKIVTGETDFLPAMEELDRLESLLSSIARNGNERHRIAARLEAIMDGFRDATFDDTRNDRELEEATDDEMFSLVEKELGIAEFD
jgi:acyl carrier protein